MTSFRRRASFIFTVINLCSWLQEELRNSVTKIRKEQQLTIKVLRNDIETAAAVAAAAASQVPADYASQSQTLAFDRSSWNHLASLSEQIAMLEERIEGCEWNNRKHNYQCYTFVIRLVVGWGCSHITSPYGYCCYFLPCLCLRFFSSVLVLFCLPYISL